MKLYHFTKAEHGLAAIGDRRIKIACIHELNDPFELLPMNLKNKELRPKFKAFKNWVAKSYGILCFSRDWENPLMWSHYADRYRGVALEFLVSDQLALEVNYELERTAFDIRGITLNGSFAEDDLYKVLTTKFAHWSYESEVRVLSRLDQAIFDGRRYFERFNNDLLLTGIVLGAACDISDEHIALVLQRGQAIERRVSRAAFGSYAVIGQKRCPDKMIEGIGVQQ